MSNYDFLKMLRGLIDNQSKEYLIKCGKGDGTYLNYNSDNGDYELDTSSEFGYWKTKFTIKEIIKIVEKDIFYLDWSRVELEEVKGDGRNENE